MSNGCFGCANRHIGCHGTCEKYKNWKREMDKSRQERRNREKRYSDYFYHN